MWLTDDQQDLWRAYLAMSGRLQAALGRQLQRDHGLSLADYDVLVAITERPECRMGELGAHLGWEQSRVSHQLARMRARGLIERTGSADDRRAAVVTLTVAGRDALEAAAPGHVQVDDDRVEGLRLQRVEHVLAVVHDLRPVPRFL